MRSKQSDADAEDQEVTLQKKKIIFRNPKTLDIITEVQIPRYIKIVIDFFTQTNSEIYDMSPLRNKLKMLYTDVLHRGFHPIKGFEKSARNVFKPLQFQPQKFSSSVNVIPISSAEAVGTIWRCLGRQIGRPIKKYEIKSIQKQLFDQLNRMSQQCKLKMPLPKNIVFQNGSKEANYIKIQQELKNIKNQISKQFQNLQYKYKEDDEHIEAMEKTKANVVKQQIIQLQKQIFLKSVIGIRQFEENTQLVEFVMEQSYPNISMSRQIAIKSIGEATFKQKWMKYQEYSLKYDLTEDNIHICHRCLTPINQIATAASCNDECATMNVGYTLLTDPYLYNRMVINENCSDKQTRNYIHPYLIYYDSSEKSAICNRYYCNKCYGMQPILQETGHCGYCQGICDCIRCQGMDYLTKMMAVFLDCNGNLPELTNKFLMQFTKKVVILKKKRQIRSMRQNQAEFKQLYDFFKQNKIFLKKSEIDEYRKIEYFSQRIQRDAKQKHEKYKMSRLKIEESKGEQLERRQKQNEKEKRAKQAQSKLQKIRQYGVRNYKKESNEESRKKIERSEGPKGQDNEEAEKIERLGGIYEQSSFSKSDS